MNGGRPLRLLMFAPGFAPYAASENIVNSKLALAFLDRGWDLEVISRTDQAYYGSQWQEPWGRLQPLTHEVRPEQRSGWSRWSRRAADLVAMRYPIPGLGWARRALALAEKLHAREPFDVVLSRATPDAAHLPALLFARATGAPWLANWNDPGGRRMPPPYRDAGGLGGRAIDDRFLRRVAAAATVHTFPAARLRDYICSYLGPAASGKTAVIPHVALPARHFERPLDDGVFRLCHAGRLDQARNPAVFLRGFADFVRQERLGDGRALFINIGVDDHELAALAARHGLQGTVALTGALGYRETLERLAASQVVVLVEAPCAEGIFLPSKLVDYIQTGRPVLAVSPGVGTLHDILSREGGGLAADCRSSADVCRALTMLFQSWRDGTLEEMFGSGHLRERYAPHTIVGQYETLFRENCGIFRTGSKALRERKAPKDCAIVSLKPHETASR